MNDKDEDLWEYKSVRRENKSVLSKASTNSIIAQTSKVKKKDTSKRKKATDKTSKRNKNTAIAREINPNATSLNGKSENGSSSSAVETSMDYCPFCQMPLEILRAQSSRSHVIECMDLPFKATKECPEGKHCTVMELGHYRAYLHSSLAKHRSNLHPQDVDSPAHELKRSSPAENDDNDKHDDPVTPSTSGVLSMLGTFVQSAKKSLTFTSDNISRATSSISNSSDKHGDELINLYKDSDAVRTNANPSLESVQDSRASSSCDNEDSQISENISDDDIFKNEPSDDEFFQDALDSLLSDDSNATANTQNTDQIQLERKPIRNSNSNYDVSDLGPSLGTKSSSCNSINNTQNVAHQNVSPSKGKSPLKRKSTQTNIMSFFASKTQKVSQDSIAQKTVSYVKNTPSHSTAKTNVQNGKFSLETKVPVKPLMLKQASSVVKKETGNKKPGYLKSEEESSQSTGGYANRSCPFYKKMPGTPFTVDAFRYGDIPGCEAYFLTHFHYDHYGGLRKSFAHPIYCSKATANLVESKIKVDRKYLNVIPLNTPTRVRGVEVTFMDANHCAGAVIILFTLPDGRVYLHTGDFRASTAMQRYPALSGVRVNQLYLDTTYCDPQYAFPPQDDVIRFAVETTNNYLHEHPNALIVVGSYTIGKERVFMGIAEALNCKVCVSREKMNVLKCLEDDVINSRVTLEPNKARVHVVGMKDLNHQGLSGLLDKLKPRYDSILAFEPTGWTHSSKVPSVDNIKPKWRRDPVTLFGIPYSEHSSYTEMKEFCQFVKADKILPTVNVGNPQSRRKMETLFASWKTESPSKQLKQGKLMSWCSQK